MYINCELEFAQKRPLLIRVVSMYVCILACTITLQGISMKTSCAGGRHNMPPPPASWPFDLESGVRVTCDVDYLCANFSLSRPLCSWHGPNVRDRQTSDA